MFSKKNKIGPQSQEINKSRPDSELPVAIEIIEREIKQLKEELDGVPDKKN